MRWMIGIGAVLLCMVAMADFDVNEIEQLDKLEQQDLLGAARTAAKEWDFDTAEHYLAQARQKGQAAADLKAVAILIADNRAAKLAKEQKEAEAQRQAAQTQQEANNGSAVGTSTPAARSDVDMVSVNISPTCSLGSIGCYAKDLQLSGGSNQFSSIGNSNGSGAIFKGFDGKTAGQYNYSVRLEESDRQQLCSGSFPVDGTKRNVTIFIHFSDCQANIGVF